MVIEIALLISFFRQAAIIEHMAESHLVSFSKALFCH